MKPIQEQEEVTSNDSGFDELQCSESLSVSPTFHIQSSSLSIMEHHPHQHLQPPPPRQQQPEERSPLVESGRLTYYSEMRKRKVLYTPVRELGAGAFGTVYRCVDSESPDAVAIKYIRIHDAVDGIPQWALREIALLRRCSSRHPNIISLLDMHCRLIDGKRCDIHLILEFCDMDLKQYIGAVTQRNGLVGLESKLIKELMYQMLQGLDFLHVIAVAHRDIKPQNVLMKKGVIKIADFGLGKVMFERAPVSLEVVTLHYRPPEVLLNVNYSLAVDIWSIGCIFAEMCNNKVLLSGDSELNQLKIIFSVLGIPKQEDWPQNCSVGREFFLGSADRSAGFFDDFSNHVGMLGVDLLKNMLKFNPAQRHSTFSALRHDYFKGHISSVVYMEDPPTPALSHFGLVERGQISPTPPSTKLTNSPPSDLCRQMRGL
ncbi:Cyclin-dependent kinase 4 [Hypsibius exemplaris]|uniref:Cyclin-dependent kinase 4 n=1 Tax=Hypsibius exemplaris TaxID=2072580 RepID=A0A1W0X3J5_HYPEX|nr:Cyclin-dependent kinase 4 [Hypsibius exemplaris]